MQLGSDLGRVAEPFMERGDLVPEHLMAQMVVQELGDCLESGLGFVLDGFPRTLSQGETLFDVLAPLQIDVAVNIDVPLDVVRDRLGARRVCTNCSWVTTTHVGEAIVPCRSCGGEAVQRSGDTPDSIARRLTVYESQIGPVLKWLQRTGLLVTVNGVGSAEEVAQRIRSRISTITGAECQRATVGSRRAA